MKYRCFIGLCLVVLILLTGCGQKSKDIEVNTGISNVSKENIQDISEAEGKEPTTSEQEILRPVYDYVFDLKDKDAVSESSGTGGTEWKGHEETDYSKYVDENPNIKTSIQGVKFEKTIRIVGMENEKLMNDINRFLSDAEERLIHDKDYWVNGGISGEIKIWEFYNCYEDLISIGVRSTREYKDKDICAVFNIKTGNKLSLSDFFYDGFNYIDYINSHIVNELEGIGFEDYNWEMVQYEFSQKRSYTGIPKDYPYFDLSYTGITIYFPNGNLFFDNSAYGYTEFYIDLNQDISPYAWKNGKWISYDYEEIDFPDGISTLKPIVSNTRSSQTDELINNSIEEMINEIEVDNEFLFSIKDDMKYLNTDTYLLRPDVCQSENYLSITYGYYMDSVLESMLKTVAFDVNTGQIVDLTKLIPQGLDWSEVRMHPKALTKQDFEEYREKTVTITDPPKVINAWFTYYSYLGVDAILSDGTAVTGLIPIGNIKGEISQ